MFQIKIIKKNKLFRQHCNTFFRHSKGFNRASSFNTESSRDIFTVATPGGPHKGPGAFVARRAERKQPGYCPAACGKLMAVSSSRDLQS